MEIKPCPFCGSEDIEYSVKHKGAGASTDGYIYDSWHTAMFCKRCHTYGPRNLVKFEIEDLFTNTRNLANTEEHVNEAIRLWNERV